MCYIYYLKKKDGCFQNIYIAYKILLNMSVMVAHSKRTFSVLKLIKIISNQLYQMKYWMIGNLLNN